MDRISRRGLLPDIFRPDPRVIQEQVYDLERWRPLTWAVDGLNALPHPPARGNPPACSNTFWQSLFTIVEQQANALRHARRYERTVAWGGAWEG